MMKPDCIFYDGCYLPKDQCTDDCQRYDKEGKHPLDDSGQADYLRDIMIEERR